MLMSVPNVSEGVDEAAVGEIGEAFRPAKLVDIHSDPDHHRSVFTLVSKQGELARALARGASKVHSLVNVSAHEGIHPHVGAIDVVPIVYVTPEQRGAACAEALATADLIARSTETPV